MYACIYLYSIRFNVQKLNIKEKLVGTLKELISPLLLAVSFPTPMYQIHVYECTHGLLIYT